MILRGHAFSKTLVMETGLTFLVPGAALEAARPPPVVYLLHGVCGRSGDWLDYTTLALLAERHPAIYVMPEVARSFYTDMAYGQRFFSYVVDELPGIVHAAFRASRAREDTAVVGASMGGYGALKCALSRPEAYGRCAAISSACLFLKEGLERQRREGHTAAFRQAWGERILNDFEAAFGPALEWRPELELLELARRATAAGAPPEVFLACGAQDPFRADNARFAAALPEAGVPGTYQEWPGGHDFAFFGAALERALDHLFGAPPRG